MATFQKQDIPVNTNCETVFEFLGDFRNFESLLPDRVTNWKADELTCSFTIQGLSDLSMRIDGKYPCRNIRIVSDGKNPVNYKLDYHFRPAKDQACEVDIVFDVNLNPFLKSIASGPLQHFVDMLAEKLQEKYR
ncbi:MAG: hypothetical protein EA394_08330 [Bacteroidia bacterium]|nr:MAG: hypothetical protein EA394_08330 [Bacteroidia bacterium]